MIRPNILILDYFKLKNRRYAHFIAFYARFTAYNISYNIYLWLGLSFEILKVMLVSKKIWKYFIFNELHIILTKI